LYDKTCFQFSTYGETLYRYKPPFLFATHHITSTEVLSASGLMEDMPDFVNDNVENVKSAKNRVLREADKFRKGVRTALRKERMAAFGFAGGAFMGIVM